MGHSHSNSLEFLENPAETLQSLFIKRLCKWQMECAEMSILFRIGIILFVFELIFGNILEVGGVDTGSYHNIGEN